MMKNTAALFALALLPRALKVDLRGTETMLLRKSADDWRIVHIAATARR